jgi:hypothetical protein
VRDQGVRFADSHSVFPTLTMVNSAAMGTGHFPGDTGNYGNTIYTGFPVASANGSVAPMVESDAILGEINAHFGGNYLNEETLLAAARNAGFLTAAVGKVGPAAIYDVTERSGAQTIVIDDLTGRPGGLLLSNSTLDALQAAMLPIRRRFEAITATSVTRKPRELTRLTSHNSATSPTSRRNPYCQCSKRRGSRSCWYSGRAIRTARNITRAIA